MQKRWARLALQLTPQQAQGLVERAAAKRLATQHIQAHAPQGATEGWALESQGYQALTV